MILLLNTPQQRLPMYFSGADHPHHDQSTTSWGPLDLADKI